MSVEIFRLIRTATDGQTIAGHLMDGTGWSLCSTLEPGHKVPQHPCIPVGEHKPFSGGAIFVSIA